ncbi:prim-pol domain-containing protein [Lindgomyces ingoldianus]|uniref:Prim-pol domain-containing protein n=1 Tax=Lindgomyces ingoldianus TaxID=673940 RepID=A0ACB6RHH0_9PLEO|nr:prim-pol domain-containing protein [Lindgomyces ingoldianus]KAF2477921.1 prim-pol domain-containing protein [Lindgomyces ingoldianus]
MPHSISPESTPAEDSSMPHVNAQPLKSEPSTPSKDIAMSDALSSPEDSKTKVNLEGLFDDEDSDLEFPSSASQIKSEEEPSQPEPFRITSRSTFSDPEIMRAFYQRLFPFRYLFQWLNHNPTPSNDFAHREFAFTLPNDAYLRYQSFPTADLLRKQCIQLLPSRFEIGPVYSTNPRDRKTVRKASAFRPLTKELVFDIDMTDYDDVRTCCTGASICHKCWAFITMAIKVVDVALRDDFGFKHILWVYSGRRGAHAWVCDKRARELDDSKRRAIAGYLELLKGGDQGGKKVNVRRPLHPHLDRSLNILKEHFQTSILIEQDPWAEEKYAHLLQLLPDPTLRAALQKKWDSSPSRPSTSKWSDIDNLAKTGALSKTSKELLEAKQDIVLEYTYPRLDAEVSKKLNHLLKSPFVVHPGTGRVCVPIDTRKVEEFDPLSVPTVTQLLSEIDEWEGEGEQKVQDWEKTSLVPYVEFFRTFVGGLLKEERRGLKREREEGGDEMEF